MKTTRALREMLHEWDRLITEGEAHGMARPAAIERASRTMTKSLSPYRIGGAFNDGIDDRTADEVRDDERDGR